MTPSSPPLLLKILAAAGIAAATAAAGASVAEVAPARASAAVGRTDRLIVKYRDAAPATGTARKAIVDRAGQQFGMILRHSHRIATGADILTLERKVSLAEAGALAAELMARDASVEYAEPDRIMTRMLVPTDPMYNQQWHYFEAAGGLRLPGAWDQSTGAGVKVAVIDTGYRPHADLAGQFLPGYDFITSTAVAGDGNGRDSDASDPGDATADEECGAGQPGSSSSWHGTHVAGTIAARTNNGAGVAGIAYNARVLPVRVLGKCGGYTSDIADAIVWSSGGKVGGVPANANPARVINMSLGGGGACGATTQNAINGARARGTVVIVAAGNSSADVSSFSPANCAGVVAVAAVGRSGGRASYSNYGALVDVAAPGGDGSSGVLSTLNSGSTAPASDSYAYYQGTSMAAPHVAGVAALMLSRNPALTPDQVESKLKGSARAFPAACSECGSGIVDASAAVLAAGGATPAPPPAGPTMVESEANNTTGSADAVGASGVTISGNIGSSTDTDYFSVQLPAGTTLRATLTMGATADYNLYAYNRFGTQVAKSENGIGATDTLATTNTGRGTTLRYIRVKYNRGATGATDGGYSLKLSW
jgi:serine protease